MCVRQCVSVAGNRFMRGVVQAAGDSGLDSSEHPWAALYRRDGVLVLSNLLSDVELRYLRAECDSRRAGVTDSQLCANDCVLEALPRGSALPPEDHAARTSPQAYLRIRHDSGSGDVDVLQQLLLCKLPAVAAAARGRSSGDNGTDAPQLFNEHFVVKPPRVAGPFEWHTDAAHQLEALFALGRSDAVCAHVCTCVHAHAHARAHAPAWMDMRTDLRLCPLMYISQVDEYLSIWIPLDGVHRENGPLLVLPWSATQPPEAPWHQPASDHTSTWLASATGVASTSGLSAGAHVHAMHMYMHMYTRMHLAGLRNGSCVHLRPQRRCGSHLLVAPLALLAAEQLGWLPPRLLRPGTRAHACLCTHACASATDLGHIPSTVSYLPPLTYAYVYASTCAYAYAYISACAYVFAYVYASTCAHAYIGQFSASPVVDCRGKPLALAVRTSPDAHADALVPATCIPLALAVRTSPGTGPLSEQDAHADALVPHAHLAEDQDAPVLQPVDRGARGECEDSCEDTCESDRGRTTSVKRHRDQ